MRYILIVVEGADHGAQAVPVDKDVAGKTD
jgi:hypothetical protein